jgi:hypothetical protein
MAHSFLILALSKGLAMVKAKDKPQSFSAYFEQLFTANPSWLDDSSNEHMLRQWEKDHPGQPMSPNIRSILANKKSKMREKLGLSHRRRRSPFVPEPTAARSPRGRSALGALENLEILIDDCLILARQQQNPELECVIKHLRVARRGVILAMGRDGAPGLNPL